MSEKEKKITEPSIDFSGLILGFSSAALHYLEQASKKQGEDSVKNLTLAGQNIEIIRIIQEKTRGNLTSEESKLIEQILRELENKQKNL